MIGTKSLLSCSITELQKKKERAESSLQNLQQYVSDLERSSEELLEERKALLEKSEKLHKLLQEIQVPKERKSFFGGLASVLSDVSNIVLSDVSNFALIPKNKKIDNDLSFLKNPAFMPPKTGVRQPRSIFNKKSPRNKENQQQLEQPSQSQKKYQESHQLPQQKQPLEQQPQEQYPEQGQREEVRQPEQQELQERQEQQEQQEQEQYSEQQVQESQQQAPVKKQKPSFFIAIDAKLSFLDIPDNCSEYDSARSESTNLSNNEEGLPPVDPMYAGAICTKTPKFTLPSFRELKSEESLVSKIM